MDKFKKLLKKISKEDKLTLIRAINILKSGENHGLNINKIKGTDYYRVRVKNIRIIFGYNDNKVVIFDVRPKNKNTYKKLGKLEKKHLTNM